jgi:hypothetical protein
VHRFKGGFIFGDAGLEIAQHVELLLEEKTGRCGKIELLEKAQTALAEEVAALRQLQVVLGAKETMDTVAPWVRCLTKKERWRRTSLRCLAALEGM